MAAIDIGQLGELLHVAFSTEDGLKRLLETVVNAGMAEEAAAHVGAKMHERAEARRGYRNGTKPRTFKTRAGELELSVPQVRGCEPYHPGMFAKWERSERALLVACAEMYFQGASTAGTSLRCRR
jgi:putative transposase